MKFYDNDINFLVADAIVNCRELNFEGVCTLSCRTNPSSIDANGVIIPPKTIVEVLRAPRNPKNSIIELISAAYKVSVTNAYEIYRQWLENIKENSPVAGSACYVISGVGVISISLDGTISFKVERKLVSELNFLHETLEMAQIQPIVKNDSKEEVVAQETTISDQILEDIPAAIITENEVLPVIEEVVETAEEEVKEEEVVAVYSEPIIEEVDKQPEEIVEEQPKTEEIETQPIKSNDDDSKDSYQKGVIQFWKRLSLMFACLFLLALSLVVVFIFIRPDKAVIKEVKIDRVVYENSKKCDSSAVKNAEVKPALIDTVIENQIIDEPKADSVTKTTDTTASVDNSTDSDIVAIAKDNGGKYWVVGGVLKSKTNSEKMASNYKKAGFDSKLRFVESRGSYFITVAEFETANEAQNFLNNNKPIYDDIDLMFWIFENN